MQIYRGSLDVAGVNRGRTLAKCQRQSAVAQSIDEARDALRCIGNEAYGFRGKWRLATAGSQPSMPDVLTDLW
jgi:hypothetical protein